MSDTIPNHRKTTAMFRGIPVEDMTREELIEALVEMILLWESDRMRFQNRLAIFAGTKS